MMFRRAFLVWFGFLVMAFANGAIRDVALLPRLGDGPAHGGALGFADPHAETGYAYVTSQMGTTFTGDPRDLALRDAFYSSLQNS